MKTVWVLSAFCMSVAFSVLVEAEEKEPWSFSASGTLYIIPDETYFNPVISVDREHLHLEGRYNYEDLETGSLFAGYSFHMGSDSVELNVTPMVGGVFGNSNGIAPGFLLELNYQKLSVSSEGEYFFSSDEKEANFFYSWSELVYLPAEWLWFGLAGQRTRAYKTDLEIQRGLLLGFGVGNFSVTGYLMNIGWDDAFGIINVEYQF
jgi:hypothetical protein